MKKTTLLLSSIILLTILFTTCTEDPAGPDISDDLKPKGNIVGWVYDMWNQPLKDVLVSVDADSSVPCVSDAAGLFKVGQVKEGTYILRFTHRDYEDNPTCTVTVEQGVDDTLTTPVKLSYAYYILKGIISVNGSPQAAAGVAVADYTEGGLTGPGGSFILKHVPKNDTVTLIFAYGDVAVKTSKVAGLLENDTNEVGAINLTDKGPTVSGRVYYPDLSVAPNITVTAVAGGLQTKTGDDGYYTLRNIPANEDGVIVTVNEGGYIGAAIGANAVAGAIITGCDIYLKPEPNIINGIKLITCDVYVPHTAVTAILRVYPVTEVNTVIQSYIWNVGGTPYTTSLPSCPITVSGLSPITTATITAVNTFGDTSATESFTIFLTGTAPVIDSIAVSKDKITYAPSVTIMEGEWAYFYVNVTDLYGGLASMTWDFGDGAYWTAPDSNPSVGHMYSNSGVYNAVFKAVDSDSNTALDTVVVTVQKSNLQSPVLLYPDSGAVLNIPNDSITIQWSKSPGTGIVYNAYMTWSNTIPSESDSIAVGLTDSLFRTKVDSAKTYYWRVKAIRTSDSVIAWSSIFPFTVYTNIVNNAPVFITTADSMTGLMYSGVSYADTLKASDVDGDLLTFSFIDSVVGMSLIDSVFSWTLTINDTGQHSVTVKVSDSKGGNDSLTWTITVINGAPVIITDPVSKTVDEYSSAGFFIVATGDSLVYQWQKDGLDIDSANDSVYTIDSVLCADSGMYRCVVANKFGGDTSNSAKLTVKPYVAEILYVKADATGNNDGSSWADAFTSLQPALDIAQPNSQIWVAAATYKPTKEQGGTGERFKSFSMKTCVAIYGGFIGTETQLSQRDWESNVTICSGDIGVEGDSTDNCYHVFYHTLEMLIDDRSLLDGFTVTGGNANGTAPHNSGGGMYNKQSRPSINNCKFIYNSAGNGGGVYNTNAAAVKVYNCTLSNNNAGIGGGMSNYTSSNAAITKCVFIENIASGSSGDGGGGIYNHNSSPIINNTTFSANRGIQGHGGGMHNNTSSNARITNCMFSENISNGNGGGIYNFNSSPHVDSTVFSANRCLNSGCGGGGINSSGSGSSLFITDCFFTGNYGPNKGGAISNVVGEDLISNCTFLNNHTDGNGGSIFSSSWNISINNCTFVANAASGVGGGIYGSPNTGGFFRIVNCTFSGNNQANQDGGGIYLYSSDSNSVILNCVLWGNYSGSGSNEIYTGNRVPVVIKNTAIQGGFTDTMAIMSDIITTDPALGALGDNGGFVQTMALGAGSSALDKGLYVYQDDNNIFYNTDGGTSYLDIFGNPYTPVGTVTQLTKTDARGVPRPQGSGIDLGAFEKE